MKIKRRWVAFVFDRATEDEQEFGIAQVKGERQVCLYYGEPGQKPKAMAWFTSKAAAEHFQSMITGIFSDSEAD